ncbi:MAG: hypothetical protein AAF623_01965 [Planctomycetota bacterium]
MKILFALWLTIFVAIGISLILKEFPRGSDFVMVRLGSATFCRTGIPLLIIILLDYFGILKLESKALGFLSVFYIVGFSVAICISVTPFRFLRALGGARNAIV